MSFEKIGFDTNFNGGVCYDINEIPLSKEISNEALSNKSSYSNCSISESEEAILLSSISYYSSKKNLKRQNQPLKLANKILEVCSPFQHNSYLCLMLFPDRSSITDSLPSQHIVTEIEQYFELVLQLTTPLTTEWRSRSCVPCTPIFQSQQFLSDDQNITFLSDYLYNVGNIRLSIVKQNAMFCLPEFFMIELNCLTKWFLPPLLYFMEDQPIMVVVANITNQIENISQPKVLVEAPILTEYHHYRTNDQCEHKLFKFPLYQTDSIVIDMSSNDLDETNSSILTMSNKPSKRIFSYVLNKGASLKEKVDYILHFEKCFITLAFNDLVTEIISSFIYLTMFEMKSDCDSYQPSVKTYLTERRMINGCLLNEVDPISHGSIERPLFTVGNPSIIDDILNDKNISKCNQRSRNKSSRLIDRGRSNFRVTGNMNTKRRPGLLRESCKNYISTVFDFNKHLMSETKRKNKLYIDSFIPFVDKMSTNNSIFSMSTLFTKAASNSMKTIRRRSKTIDLANQSHCIFANKCKTKQNTEDCCCDKLNEIPAIQQNKSSYARAGQSTIASVYQKCCNGKRRSFANICPLSSSIRSRLLSVSTLSRRKTDALYSISRPQKKQDGHMDYLVFTNQFNLFNRINY